MSEQIDIFKVLDFIRDNARAYAQAKANRVHMEEFRKSKKAMLMRNFIDLPVSAQEREAYADAEYIDLLDGIRAAIEEEERLRWLIEGARLKAEVWRTLSANQRIEAKTL